MDLDQKEIDELKSMFENLKNNMPEPVRPPTPVREPTPASQIDIEELKNLFTLKSEPDNTIVRLEALESQALANQKSLEERLDALEHKVNDNHEKRVIALENDLKSLKDTLTLLSQPSEKSGGPDMSQILLQINFLKD